ncbi:GNAT family N-acetyltransferase [Gilliamella sp. B2776]|uniref:peptidogalycan biosysnthesis protein n=1 Tax=unclassified Gilliamella TaxID=2685620 RepID=UPI002269CB31|nr:MULTISPECIES: peptidogalycan biosysnthesis protein [unclassified Gilliamella]MCX8649754.1 GNAT family N-acetyltransferase [Gilliamella sp. B2779]MCX8653735.1 GNAT family N-acetyltransferase [Gilliamella sp. B2737]MCX8664618.1 GNAT family N-acetyltransferase [Gilliamella sp. B2887]MCX8691527.1 GNAT family N-acetyltransferase [Gilliamella sp. B2776]MCX8698349.1 GNAT family N-acetyltransferase [Gilliamella sp. B3000]
MKYINQLEKNELIDSFLTYPPQDFSAWLSDDDVPVFSAKFDLLTTANDDFKYKIQKFPFYKKWKHWLQPRTCFVGTTVSEYTLLTDKVDANQLAKHLKTTYAKQYPFMIVKDLPLASPLLSEYDNHYSEQLIEALKEQGYIEVEGQALAWLPIDFVDINEVFSRFSYSRRKNFRRKLKSRDKLDINILHSGDECFFNQDVQDEYYQLYLNVYQQSEIHFDLLTKPFFIQLLQSKAAKAHIFTYHNNGVFIGFNICFEVNNMLIDKYIGMVYPKARELNLYFVSWFVNLEYALQQGFNYYIAGWTDPEVKASLGAKFTFTKHLVYIRNPLLRVILRKLIGHFESDKEKVA